LLLVTVETLPYDILETLPYDILETLPYDILVFSSSSNYLKTYYYKNITFKPISYKTSNLESS
jgi:hypothetical protein